MQQELKFIADPTIFSPVEDDYSTFRPNLLFSSYYYACFHSPTSNLQKSFPLLHPIQSFAKTSKSWILLDINSLRFTDLCHFPPTRIQNPKDSNSRSKIAAKKCANIKCVVENRYFGARAGR
jgi:hypothetical protein